MRANVPYYLTCEYLTNPLGMDEPRPRLAWKLPASFLKQGAYRVLVSTSKEGEGDLWDSGKVHSDRSTHVEYFGKPLDPIQRAWWRVCVWDKARKQSPWSESAFWEAGLPLPNHWTGAKWIGCPSISLSSEVPPAIYFRRSFSLPSKGVSRARLFVSAKGLYCANLNGKPIGDGELTPGWTDYHRRLVYDAYDVSSAFRRGENDIEIILGDGWYCGNVCWFGRQQYGPFPEALVKLYVEFENAEPMRVVSDGSWRAFEGPIRANDLLMGEAQNLRAKSKQSHPISVAPIGQVAIVCRRSGPIRASETLTPQTTERFGKNAWLIDMGQNMVGRLVLETREVKATKVKIRHAEVLDRKGNLYLENLRSAKQADEFALAAGKQTFESAFTFHGFRYAEVSGLLSKPKVKGVVLSSLSRRTGRFRCGNKMVNQLAENIRWGMLGNYLEVPTDCPQRDERLGWMGDAQIFAPTAAYNYDIAPFMTKWLQDVRDAQSDDGAFPNVAPQMLQLSDGAPAWADAGVIVPWTIYRYYGDARILEQSWDSMARFIAMVERANPDLIWRNRASHNFGDWLNVESETPKEVLATAYFAHSASLVANTAKVLGREEEVGRFAKLFESIKRAFRNEFVSNAGRILGDTQTGYVLALRFGLLTEKQAELAAKRLSEDIKKKGHLTTGFLGVGHLLPVLTEIGRDDLAIKLLLRVEYPSWGYSIRHGATTIWERWDGWTEEKGFQDPGMNSFNHYALGSCGEWLFSRLAGIQLDPITSGFKEFLLNPLPAREIGWVKSNYETPYGRVVSNWKIIGNSFQWNYEIPPNSEALVKAPGKRARRQGAGKYSIEAKV